MRSCGKWQAIAENLPRNTDCAGRYGGEEFVVLLELTDEQGAHLMAQRLCDAVYSRLIVHATSPLRVVTISVGVATLQREHHRRVEDVLNAGRCGPVPRQAGWAQCGAGQQAH
jgi:diguanylate cyclase (GGDEF)-like protein